MKPHIYKVRGTSLWKVKWDRSEKIEPIKSYDFPEACAHARYVDHLMKYSNTNGHQKGKVK